MDIRAVQTGDLEGIDRLMRQMWPGRELGREFLERLILGGQDSDSFANLVAELDGRIVGFSSLAFRESQWEGKVCILEILVVDEEVRVRGIGRRLVEASEDEARARGCRKMVLDSGFDREKAHAFYEAVGFRKGGYVFGKGLGDP